MAKKKNTSRMEKFRIISMRKLSEASKVNYMKLYRNLSGETIENLTESEKTTLANAAHEEMKEFFKFLGFRINFERL